MTRRRRLTLRTRRRSRPSTPPAAHRWRPNGLRLTRIFASNRRSRRMAGVDRDQRGRPACARDAQRSRDRPRAHQRPRSGQAAGDPCLRHDAELMDVDNPLVPGSRLPKWTAIAMPGHFDEAGRDLSLAASERVVIPSGFARAVHMLLARAPRCSSPIRRFSPRTCTRTSRC